MTMHDLVAPDPQTGSEIRAALGEVHRSSVRFWAEMTTDTFMARIGDAWSPAENVRHLTKSMRAVTKGLRMPRLVLLLAFGRATRPSRRYAEVRETYRARLAQGADAGRFAPEDRPTPPNANAERARIVQYHATALAEMDAAITRWPEGALDRRRLPHPLLGPLTVREMLLFTVYHNQHHVENVRRHLREAPSPRST